MTISQTAWAWNQTGLTAEEKLVLLALADGTETKSRIMERCNVENRAADGILVTLVNRFPITMRFPGGFMEIKYILELKDE